MQEYGNIDKQTTWVNSLCWNNADKSSPDFP